MAYWCNNNNCPETPTEAYNQLVNYSHYDNNKKAAPPGGLDQVAFAGTGKKLRGDGTEEEQGEGKPRK